MYNANVSAAAAMKRKLDNRQFVTMASTQSTTSPRDDQLTFAVQLQTPAGEDAIGNKNPPTKVMRDYEINDCGLSTKRPDVHKTDTSPITLGAWIISAGSPEAKAALVKAMKSSADIAMAG